MAEEAWGRQAQIEVAKEELAELIVALCKLDRKVNGSTPEQVAGEMADCELMLQQLEWIFKNSELVAEIKVEKLQRLQRRLEGETKNG